MAVKVSCIDEGTRLTAYPNIQKSSVTGVIILFNSYGCGTVLHKGESIHIFGEYSTDWTMESFSPLRGKIILENEYYEF